MRFDLARRLAKLEQASPRPSGCVGLDWLSRVKIYVLAYHLGGVERREPVSDGYARALGYAASQELRRDLAGEVDVSPRHAEAMARLLAQRGVDPATAAWERQVEALDALLAELPDWLMDRSGIPPGVTVDDARL